MLVLRRVLGKSMEPTLKEGRVVIGCKWYRKLAPNDIVIFEHNNLEKIKRIKKISRDRLWIEGDNLDSSTDSKDFGFINSKTVVAKLIY